MKKNKFLSFFSLLLLMSTISHAAIEHDLQSLQHHLVALEGTLIGKPLAGGGVPKKTFEELKNALIADFDALNIEFEQFSKEKNDQEAVMKHDENLAGLFNKLGADLENLDNYNKLVDQKNARITVGLLKKWHSDLENFEQELRSVSLDLSFFVTQSSLAKDRIIELFKKSIVLWDDKAKGKTVTPSGGGVVQQPPAGGRGGMGSVERIFEQPDVQKLVEYYDKINEQIESFKEALWQLNTYIENNKQQGVRPSIDLEARIPQFDAVAILLNSIGDDLIPKIRAQIRRIGVGIEKGTMLKGDYSLIKERISRAMDEILEINKEIGKLLDKEGYEVAFIYDKEKRSLRDNLGKTGYKDLMYALGIKQDELKKIPSTK